MQASDPNSRLKLPPRPHHHLCVYRRIQDESGFALLISLLVVLLLAVMILEMDAQTRADLRAAGHFRDDLQAFHLVRSAVSAAQALLQRDGRSFDVDFNLAVQRHKLIDAIERSSATGRSVRLVP